MISTLTSNTTGNICGRSLLRRHLKKARLSTRCLPTRRSQQVFENRFLYLIMKVKINQWHAIAQWRWDTGNTEHDDGDGEGDVCGICRVPYEGCCPSCKIPGDDCPLSCVSFIFFMCALWLMVY